jgi:WD40 repeat protein
VHPVLPYVLTSSDDMLIKLWDWDKGWNCVQVFEGHSHYVMQVGWCSVWGVWLRLKLSGSQGQSQV